MASFNNRDLEKIPSDIPEQKLHSTLDSTTLSTDKRVEEEVKWIFEEIAECYRISHENQMRKLKSQLAQKDKEHEQLMKQHDKKREQLDKAIELKELEILQLRLALLKRE